jgi:hypothetical protein
MKKLTLIIISLLLSANLLYAQGYQKPLVSLGFSKTLTPEAYRALDMAVAQAIKVRPHAHFTIASYAASEERSKDNAELIWHHMVESLKIDHSMIKLEHYVALNSSNTIKLLIE